MSEVLRGASCVVVGYGGVGRALALRLRESGARVVVGLRVQSSQVTRSRLDGFDVLPLDQLDPPAHLLALAVPDPSVAEVAELLAHRWEREGLDPAAGLERGKGAEPPPVAMHLSGRLGLAALEPLAARSWEPLALHPVQAFPPGAGPERWSGIHAGVTAGEVAAAFAERIAQEWGVRLLPVPEARRDQYHLAAVIASNFLPLLLDLGGRQLEAVVEDREAAQAALLPLMRGMLEGLQRHGVGGALTGPVARGDAGAVLGHADHLTPGDREIYLALSRALVDLARREQRISERDARTIIERLQGGNGHSTR